MKSKYAKKIILLLIISTFAFGINKHEVKAATATINEVGSSFDVSIVSEDGLIEGIEYNKDDKFLIGVQFHPEVLDQYDNIFKEFINRCKK